MKQDRDGEPSLQLLLSALEASPDNVPLRVHVAKEMERAGQWAQALGHYERAVNTTEHGVEAGMGAARCALALGDLEKAIEKIDCVMALAPGHAMGLLLRARIREQRKEHGLAKRDYDKAISLDPSLADTTLWDALKPTVNETNSEQERSAPGPTDTITFSDVGGLDEVKDRIRMKIVLPFKEPELFAAYKKRAGGGVLFYGPPGCGKTFLARATAGECGAHFMPVGLHEVLDMWIGNAEQRLHALFEEARRRAPTILFFDEVDALGMQRAKLSSGAMRGVITQFLSELDGFKGHNDNVLVLGATNTPWDLDVALRRPGRFDQLVFVPPPDALARERILKLKLADKPRETLELGRLAALTDGWSGADLEHLVEQATELALSLAMKHSRVEPITNALLERARARVRPSTREWFTQARNYAQYANESGQYDDIADWLRRYDPKGGAS